MDAFASELITRLATTSVQTALLVALVWALCRALPRLPASTQCWLWWTVALQVVIGLVAAPLELPWLPAAAPVAEAPATFVTATEAAAPLALASGAAPLWTLPTWQTALLALWIAGIGVMALRTLLDWRASRALVRSSRACDDATLVGALRLAAEAHGLREAPPLRLSHHITSPQLVGVLRPVLLLPASEAARIGDDDLDMALTHELVHLRRRDLWWGLLPALAQHVAWFHPLVHVALREYGVAREAAVDAAVVAGNRHCRGDYGRLLVRLGVAPKPGVGLASASPSFITLKRRLLMLQNTRTFPRLGAGLILAVVAVAGVTPLRLVAAPQQVDPAQAAASAPDAPPPPPAALPAKPTLPPPPANKSKRVPPPPPAPPAPPVPPAAPAPPATSITGLHIPDKGSNTVWFERDGAQYVIKDAATVDRLRTLHEPSKRLGAQQGELGRQQGALGREQGELSRQMVAMGREIARKATEEARIAMQASHGAAQDEAIARQAADAARAATERATEAMQRSGLTAKIEALAREQAELGVQQAELGRQQAELSEQAAKDAEAVLERAMRSGLAQRIDG